MTPRCKIAKWAQDVFWTPARYKVAYGGRGSSKSWAAAQSLVAQATQEKHFILCAREIQLSIRDSSKRVIEAMIERMGVSSLFEIRDTYIDCMETGSRFIFWGMHDGAEKLKSAEGLTRVWVEEANTVSQKSMDTLHPTVREPGSEIWYTFNPGMKDDPVYTMFVTSQPPPGSIVRKINHDQNPWFPEVLRDQMQWDRANDPDKYRHIWEGEPVAHSHAQVFHGRWKIAPVPDPPPGTVYYHGADWGFANDPTALVRCWIVGRTLYVDRAVFARGVDTVDLPGKIFLQVKTSASWPVIADSARPETISHMRQHGYAKMRPSRKGKNSVAEGIAFLRGFDIVIDPNLKDLIGEFFLYSYKTDPKTGLILPILMDKNNHGIDALRYAVEPLQQKPKARISVG